METLNKKDPLITVNNEMDYSILSQPDSDEQILIMVLPVDSLDVFAEDAYCEQTLTLTISKSFINESEKVIQWTGVDGQIYSINFNRINIDQLLHGSSLSEWDIICLAVDAYTGQVIAMGEIEILSR